MVKKFCVQIKINLKFNPMKYANPVRGWIKEYRRKNKLTFEQVAERLKVQKTYLYRVLAHNEKCTYLFAQKLARLLDKDIEIVGIVFGYYPSDWIWFTRSHPEKALKLMIEAIEG